MASETIYATLKPLPGHEQSVKDAVKVLASKARQEPGNIRYEVYELEDGRLYFEETYKDANAMKAHAEADYFEACKVSIGDKIENGNIEIQHLTPVSTTI